MNQLQFYLLMKNIILNQINNGNETANVPSPPIDIVEFDRNSMQVPVSTSYEEDCYTIGSQKCNPIQIPFAIIYLLPKW